ncbi:hypothetical protein [Thermomonospora amylolytica]|uniref:hypothetical protein n=1 Tax=Thermomonospora amylolytica TaxID=1411117 RepID=UPI000E6D0910|nr:hypothetical protein [Thermomonospora amylolytica]
MVRQRIETPGEDGHPLCPRCGCRVAPLRYGRPGLDLVRRAEAGELVLGGCVIGDARWSCTWCNARYVTPPEPGATWTGGTRSVLNAVVAPPGGAPTDELLVITSDDPWSLELRLRDGHVWSAEAPDLFTALQDIRRRTDPLGLRLCMNAARRDTYRCSPDDPLTGHLVAFLTPGHPPTRTAWLFAQAPVGQIATVQEQETHYTEWLTTLA